VRVQVLAEGVPFRDIGARLLDEVESSEWPEGHEQLLDLVLAELVGEAADEDLVGAIRHRGAHHAQGCQAEGRDAADLIRNLLWLVVVGSSDAQGIAAVGHAVELATGGGQFNGRQLHKGEGLLSVDEHRHHWVLPVQITGVQRLGHDSAEEVSDVSLGGVGWDAAYVESSGVAGRLHIHQTTTGRDNGAICSKLDCWIEIGSETDDRRQYLSFCWANIEVRGLSLSPRDPSLAILRRGRTISSLVF
jgi:hypothetical protein